jgi:hypothetical protein
MGEDHFGHSNHWRDTIDRQLSTDGDLHVGDLRVIIDPPERPTGVPRVLTDVIICMYALTEQMALLKMGIEHELTPGKLDDSIVLVPRELPNEETWAQALIVAREVFGITQEFGIRDPRNVGLMAAELEGRVEGVRQHADRLPRILVNHGASLGLSQAEVEASKRYTEAVDFRACIQAISGGPTELVNKLVEATQGDSRRAVIGKHLTFVTHHIKLLGGLKWQLFKTLSATTFEGATADAATGLVEDARAVFTSAEVVRKLDKLAELEDRALELITDIPKPPPVVKDPPKGHTESKTVGSRAELTALFGELEALLGTHGGFEVTIRAKTEE